MGLSAGRVLRDRRPPRHPHRDRYARWTGWGLPQATGAGDLIDGLGFEYPATITAYELTSTSNLNGKYGFASWYAKLHVTAPGAVRANVFRGPFNIVINVTPQGISSPKLRTKASVFYAFTSRGRPRLRTVSKRGRCWTGSLAAQRGDALRCFVRNEILDPCFSSKRAPGVVVCPNAQITAEIEIHLTRPLPRRLTRYGSPPSIFDQPWDIELTNGRHCVLSSGASNIVDGKRLNFFCTGRVRYGLWGLPNEKTEPWTILDDPFDAKRLHVWRAIRHVWT